MSIFVEPKTSSVKNRLPYILFWSAAFLLFFWAPGFRGLWASEGRWAEITREMFLTGDCFHPTINGEPYFDKPLLTYWFIALVSQIFGRLDEWTIRIPSAVSGLAALWATVYLGRKLWSEKVGIAAGWMLLTSYGVLFWSRTASADTENLAAIILAVAWYWARRERPDFFSVLVFYLICFLGAQTKGLASVAVPIIAVFPDVISERRWRALLSFSHLAALAIGVIVYAAPFIYAGITNEEYQSSGLALAFRENIQPYFKPFDHKEPFYVYFYYLPQQFLPWTPVFLTALWGTFSSYKKLDKRTRWLVEAFVLIFLFFTFSGSRRNYYILPLLPFCALLTSVFFAAEGNEVKVRFGSKLQTWTLGLISISAIASLAVWPIIKGSVDFVPPRYLILTTALLGLLAFFSLILGRLRPGLQANFLGINQALAPCAVAATILMGGFFCRQQVSLEIYRAERPFAMALKDLTRGLSLEQIAFYRNGKTNTIFYLDRPGFIQVLPDTDSLEAFITSGEGDRVLVSQSKYLKDSLSDIPSELRGPPSLEERVYPWEPKNITRLMAWKIVEHAN